jgi:hypothetical protein
MAVETSLLAPFEIAGSDSIMAVSVTEIGASSSATDRLEDDKINTIAIGLMVSLMMIFQANK